MRVLLLVSSHSVAHLWLTLCDCMDQYIRLPCPSPTPGACSNSCPLCQWYHPTNLSSVVPFSSCLQSFPSSGSFPMSQFFASGGQSIGVSAWASVLPMNIQDWFSLGLTGWVSLATTIMNIYSLCVMPIFFSAQFLLFFFVNNSSFLFQNCISLFLLVFLFGVANRITSFHWM